VILLCGIPSETPLALVRAELDALGAPVVTFNQRRFADADMSFELRGGELDGALRLDGLRHRLSDVTAVYLRLMDDQALPELRGEPPGSAARVGCRGLHEALTRWCEIAPIRIVNRMAPMGSNFSKPYQAQLIQDHGLRVPETVVTNDPQTVRDFRAAHGRVIYKSISGIRSIVATLSDEDMARLVRVRWCPVQFQAFIDGTHVRVHTIGEVALATAIESDATDYRYARQQGGGEPRLRALDLSDELAERCVGLSRALGLDFAGIDLKVTPDGEVFCFEVNPSPAFSYYEQSTGQPIARAVAAHLAGRG
jgi:hypothetical protein